MGECRECTIYKYKFASFVFSRHLRLIATFSPLEEA